MYLSNDNLTVYIGWIVEQGTSLVLHRLLNIRLCLSPTWPSNIWPVFKFNSWQYVLFGGFPSCWKDSSIEAQVNNPGQMTRDNGGSDL